MNIFSSLFFREADDDGEEEETIAPPEFQPENAPIGELLTGMTLDVFTMQDIHLLKGKITALQADSLTLERLPGGLAFPVSSLDATLKASGLDRRMIPVKLRAAVLESTRTVLRLKNIQIDTHPEVRTAFRLPVGCEAALFRRDDEHLKNPEPCTLVDISTGGACVQTEYIHMEDEVLQLHVQLESYTPMDFLGQIIRCEECRPGLFQYGILFAQLTESEISNLNRILYNLQAGNKSTHMRTQIGHW